MVGGDIWSMCVCDVERHMGSVVGGNTWDMCVVEMVEEMSHILSVQLASVYFYPVLGLLCVKLQYSLSPFKKPNSLSVLFGFLWTRRFQSFGYLSNFKRK